MMKHNQLQKKYFFRQLIRHLVIITLPLLILGLSLTRYAQSKLQEELAVYSERSKNYTLSQVTGILNIFSEETDIFSNNPSMALSIYKLMNEQSLDYRNNVYRSLVSALLSPAANINTYVDSVYLYYDNPYGNYFSSSKGYTSIDAKDNTDSEWLSIYQDTSSNIDRWLSPRTMRNYNFENEVSTVSIFRRLHSMSGVIVLNLNTEKLSQMLDAAQIYQGSYTLIANQNGELIFSNSEWTDSSIPQELLELPDTSDSPYGYTSFNHTEYIYYTSTISDYELVMITLLPSSEVFRSVNTMVMAFTVIILFSILLSISLSLSVTVGNFRQLRRLLDLFSSAEQRRPLPVPSPDVAHNEYDIIFNNIIQTFITNNLLQLNLAEATVKQKDAQLAALQLQLNPHFIFNTLQTLDLEILKGQEGTEHASLLIHNLSDILKYSLENSANTVCLREEIQICKSYAEIQKLRYRNPFILYWDYEDDVLDVPVLHLLLQPLLENSLHHGIKDLPRKGLVKIRIFHRHGRIYFSIIDNGRGISPTRLISIRESLAQCSLTEPSHIGLCNTNMRLTLTYGTDAALSINSRENRGTVVRFSFACTLPSSDTIS